MTLQLEPTLEAQLNERAQRDGVPPEDLVISAVRKLLRDFDDIVPQDEWERGLLSIGLECNASIPDLALTREYMYK